MLRDDEDAVWAHLQTLKDARVDFALDNAGYEASLSLRIHRPFLTRAAQLFTDFVFADFLVTYTPYVSRVVFQSVPPLCTAARLISYCQPQADPVVRLGRHAARLPSARRRIGRRRVLPAVHARTGAGGAGEGASRGDGPAVARISRGWDLGAQRARGDGARAARCAFFCGCWGGVDGA